MECSFPNALHGFHLLTLLSIMWDGDPLWLLNPTKNLRELF